MDIPATSDNIPGTLVLRDAAGAIRLATSTVVERFSDISNGGAATILFEKARGSKNNPQLIQSGDGVGAIIFRAYDGVDYRSIAFIRAGVDGSSGASDMPGNISFHTTADGTVSTTSRMIVKNGGQVRFMPLTVDPAGAEAGDVYYNSGTNKLRVHNGTSWVDLH